MCPFSLISVSPFADEESSDCFACVAKLSSNVVVPESSPEVSHVDGEGGNNSYSNIIRILTQDDSGNNENNEDEDIDVKDLLGDEDVGDEVNPLSDPSTVPSDAISAFVQEQLKTMKRELLEEMKEEKGNQSANIDAVKEKDVEKEVCVLSIFVNVITYYVSGSNCNH